MAEVPFTAEDLVPLQQSPLTVLERYYPGCTALLERNNPNPLPLLWGKTAWSVQKANILIGYQPKFNFDGFLGALESGDSSYYPYQGLPWWGV